MSIKETTLKIEKLKMEGWIGSAHTFTAEELQKLSRSHTSLLNAAKEFMEGHGCEDGLDCPVRKRLEAAIAEAEGRE